MHEHAEDVSLDPHADSWVVCDRITHRIDAGHVLTLAPGESVTLMPGNLQKDDETGNIFHPPLERFSGIEEDEAPVHQLVSDYLMWLP